MNNRIKELMIQGMTETGRLEDVQATYQRFAELIVAECMRMCEVTEMSFVTHGCDVEASGAITVKQFIAEHFGVEE
jgi:hypothetical protein